MKSKLEKVVITGGTGFVGSHLVKYLCQSNCEVIVITRSNEKLRDDMVGRIRYIPRKDLLKSKIDNIDICIHLAAYGVDSKKNDFNELVNANIIFVKEVIDFCVLNNVAKLINTGSCFEYGNIGIKRANEKTEIKPESLYGATKAAGVIIANTYAKMRGIPLITIRPFGIYGEGEAENRLVPQLMKAFFTNTKLNLTGGEQIRDYLYIDDVISAIIELATNGVPLYQTYNICSAKEISIREFVEYMIKIAGASKELFQFGALPYRKNELMYYVGDNSLIRKYTNWLPKVTFEEGFEKILLWYKEKNIGVSVK